MTREQQIQKALQQGYSQEEINSYIDSIDNKPNLNTIGSITNKPNLNTTDSITKEPSNDSKVFSPEDFTQEELNILNQTPDQTPIKPSDDSKVFSPEDFTKEELDILNKVPEVEGPILSNQEIAKLDEAGETASEYLGVDAEDVPFFDRIKFASEEGYDSFEDIFAGYGLAFGDLDEQQKGIVDIKSKAVIERLTAVPTLKARDITRIFKEEGLIPAGAQIPSFLMEQLLMSGPQMIVPMIVTIGVTAAATAATVAAIPAAIMAGLAGVTAYGLQQFGNFMNTQGLEVEAPEELDVGRAAKWAAATAPIGFLADKFLFGLSLLPKKQVLAEVTKALAARSVTGAVTTSSAKGVVSGFIAEAPTEVLETWAEFHQANIATDSEEAYEAYFEAFWSGGGLGGTLGGASRAYQGYKKHKAAIIKVEENRLKKIEAEKKETGTEETRASVIRAKIEEQKEATLKFKANKAKKANTDTLNQEIFTLLGIKKSYTGAKNILGLDLNQPGNIDVAISFLEEVSKKPLSNSGAIKNYIASLKRKKNKAAKDAKKETIPIANTDVGGATNTDVGGATNTDVSGANVQPTETAKLNTLLETKEGIETVLKDIRKYFPDAKKKTEINKIRAFLKKQKAEKITSSIEDLRSAKLTKAKPKTIPESKLKPLKVTPKGKLNPITENIINKILNKSGININTTNATNIDRNLQTRIINDVNETARQAMLDYDQTEGKRSRKDFIAEIEDSIDIMELETSVLSTETVNTIKDLAPKQEVQNDTREPGTRNTSRPENTGSSSKASMVGRPTNTEQTDTSNGNAVVNPKSTTGGADATTGGVDPALVGKLVTITQEKSETGESEVLSGVYVNENGQPFIQYNVEGTTKLLKLIKPDAKIKKVKVLASKQKGKEGEKTIVKSLKSKKTLGQVLSILLKKHASSLSPAQKELIQVLASLKSMGKTKFKVVEGLEFQGDNAYGAYNTQQNSIEISDNAGIETILHEATHAATSNELSNHIDANGNGITNVGKQLVKLYNQSKDTNQDATFDEALSSIDEFIAESFTNSRFQKFLSSIISEDTRAALEAADDYIVGLDLYDKKPTNKEIKAIKREFLGQYQNNKPISTVWTNLISSIKQVIKGKKVHYSVLNDVISLAPELFVGPNVKDQSKNPQLILFKKSIIKKQVEDNKSDKQKDKDRRKKEGAAIEDPVNNFPDKTNVPFLDKAITLISSFDSALNRAIRRELNKSGKTAKEIFKALMRMDIGQSLHASTLAQSYTENGNITYMEDRLGFGVTEGEFSMAKVRTKVLDFAKKHTSGDLKLAEEFIGQAFVALRARFFKDQNRLADIEAQKLRNIGKDKEADTLLRKMVLVPESDAQIDELIKRFDEYPELTAIHEQWIGVKNDVLSVLLAEQVIDQAMYDELAQVVDVEGFTEELQRDIFVPYYREEQPRTPGEARTGRGGRSILLPIKGSFEPVANVFDNMEKFVRAGITQAIINRTAREKIAGALEYLPNDIKKVTQRSNDKVSNAKDQDNVVEIHQHDENGKVERAYYEFSNTFYAKSVKGVEAGMTAGSNMFASASVFLRDMIVLNPVFGVGQAFVQDMHSAFFTSGLRYGPMTIPFRVLAEFPLTVLGLSKTHDYLQKQGATGGTAYRQSESVMDADINAPGAYNTIRRGLATIPGVIDANPIKIGQTRLSIGALLARIAMASDNAVRQAVYQQAKLEGRSEAFAIKVAIELINFRRVGSSEYITMGRTYIPFFGAAIQAMSVQAKAIQGMVVQGGGVTPQTRATHTINFMATWAQVAGISLIYNMLKDDDDALEALTGLDSSESAKEEFRGADPKTRDRRYIIGDSGFQLTLRPDIFTYLGKILPEQVYQSMVAESQDAAKFWANMKRNAVEIVQLNLIPQLLRPLINVRYNFDPRTGRAIIPLSVQGLPPDEQYTAGTSEAAKQLAKILNKTSILGDVSPLNVDYYFRQYTGYLGGAGNILIDEMLFGADVLKRDRPDTSFRDTIASIPGMSNFMRTEKGNRFVADLFELKAEATKVVNTFNYYDKNGWDRGFSANDFLSKGNNRKLYNAKSSISRMMETIKKLRAEEKLILEAPKEFMDGAVKKEKLDYLHEAKLDALQGILNLRKEVYGVNPFDGWGEILYKTKEKD